MKQGSNPRRGRNRGGGKRQSRNSNFDSNGPEGRVRGTAQQVFEKYVTLARDAQSAGDRIASENFFQHAEHYYRIMNADNDNGRDQQRGRRRNGEDFEDDDGNQETGQNTDGGNGNRDQQHARSPGNGGDNGGRDETRSSGEQADSPSQDDSEQAAAQEEPSDGERQQAPEANN